MSHCLLFSLYTSPRIQVGEIVRQDIVHCFQMALKRLSNLFELVDCSGPEAAGGGGLQRDSAKRAGSGGDSGSSGSSDVF
tara:strand:- start:384 stop:623 length:240 start_codon:yes stop_codon:yes gene_type:complete